MDESARDVPGRSRAFSDRVHAVAEAQWSAPTPDAEWTVADLVDHLVDEHRWVPPLLHGHDLRPRRRTWSRAPATIAGRRRCRRQPRRAWDEAATASADAVARAGRPRPRGGTVPRRNAGAQYLDEMIFDLVVHSWDLGHGDRLRQPLPDELVAFALRRRSPNVGDVSESEHVRAAGRRAAGRAADRQAGGQDRARSAAGRPARACQRPRWLTTWARRSASWPASSRSRTGRVMTYGDVAEFVGTRSARTVGRVLAPTGARCRGTAWFAPTAAWPSTSTPSSASGCSPRESASVATGSTWPHSGGTARSRGGRLKLGGSRRSGRGRPR